MNKIMVMPHTILVNGKALDLSPIAKGENILITAYRQYVKDYPKFYKMDGLSKLGFIASELLLASEGKERFINRDDRAVILFTKNGSIDADRYYQQTINAPDNYYPSPSAFVYTLPNIVAGEIAIRNNYHGETCVYVEQSHIKENTERICRQLFLDETTQSALCGFVDYMDESHFLAVLYIKEKQTS